MVVSALSNCVYAVVMNGDGQDMKCRCVSIDPQFVGHSGCVLDGLLVSVGLRLNRSIWAPSCSQLCKNLINVTWMFWLNFLILFHRSVQLIKLRVSLVH